MRPSSILPIVLSVVVSTLAFAEGPTLLDQVSSLHASGKTAEALTLLESSTLRADAPGPYYYNRGVLLHALAKYGLAVASFEKASVLGRGRAEVTSALTASRTELSRTLGPARLDPASNTFEKIGDEIPFDPFLIFFAGLTLLGGIVIYGKKRKWASRLGILTLCTFLFLLTFVFWRHWMSDHPAAVVVDAATVRSGPGNDYLDLANVDVGMKIRILIREGTWWKVRYSADGGMGYLPAESLLLLVE